MRRAARLGLPAWRTLQQPTTCSAAGSSGGVNALLSLPQGLPTCPLALSHAHAAGVAAPPGLRSFSSSPLSLNSRFGSTRITDYYMPLPTPANLGVLVVPEKVAYVVERFGKYAGILEAGLHFLIPLVDRVAYVHSLKELAMHITQQTAITRDNVTITIDGMLYVKVVDPVKASYGVDNALYAVSQLAQTTMRSELGKITLDKTFEEREALNTSIVAAINGAAEAWGLTCLRYEIRDIMPPRGIVQAMELQAEAERRKRASVLESEGVRQSKINVAEADKQEVILASEASREEAVNRAIGEAEALYKTSEASARAIELVARALKTHGGSDAAALRIAQQYIEAFREVAKTSTTMLLPAQAGDPAAMVAQATSIFRTASTSMAGGSSTGGPSTGGPSSSQPASGQTREQSGQVQLVNHQPSIGGGYGGQGVSGLGGAGAGLGLGLGGGMASGTGTGAFEGREERGLRGQLASGQLFGDGPGEPFLSLRRDV